MDHSEMLPDGLHWNEATLEERSPLNDGLLLLIANNESLDPKPIGTGFVVAAHGNFAVAITAAHNVQGMADAQSPLVRSHPSTPKEFLPKQGRIDLDRGRARALCSEDGVLESATISAVFWDKSADIAFLKILTQEASNQFFKAQFTLSPYEPTVGESVVALGYEAINFERDVDYSNSHRKFSGQRRLICRAGRITAIHKEHDLCRSPCIETSIPVFHGMSGGPVVVTRAGTMHAIALVCSGPKDGHDAESNLDRAIPGKSIMALLNTSLRDEDQESETFEFRLRAAEHALLK